MTESTGTRFLHDVVPYNPCQTLQKYIAHPPRKKGSNATHTNTHTHSHTQTHTHTHTHIRKFQCYLGLVVLVRMTVMFATHMTKCKSLWNSQVCNMFGSGTAPDPKKKFICLINGRVLNTKVLAYIFATI